VKSISGQVRGAQGKKRKMVMRFARRLLQLKKDSTPVQLKVGNTLNGDSVFLHLLNVCWWSYRKY
jgi:hypothetical protein